MIRAVCCIALTHSAMDNVIRATGDRPSLLDPAWLWLHLFFAIVMLVLAIRVAIWGTEG